MRVKSPFSHNALFAFMRSITFLVSGCALHLWQQAYLEFEIVLINRICRQPVGWGCWGRPGPAPISTYAMRSVPHISIGWAMLK